ncbi:MAG: hypothetical protein GY769_10020 [bacterium]|nr:hypothetical protein [bacterium]
MRTLRDAPSRAIALGTGAVLALALLAWAAALPDKAVELRNRGFAELENEQPAQAEQSFRELTKLTPNEPLAYANLAISLLRQQKTDEAIEAIETAESKSPNNPRLIAIRGEILSWGGNNAAGLEAFRAAAQLAPNDLEAQYLLYRTATTTGGDEAAPVAAEALDRLARLRPENLVVLLQIGKSARDSGDRARASGAYLRVRELIWQAPQGADRLLDDVLDKLEANDLDGARVPSLRLENMLKVTAMYRESLRELQTGVQGIPLTVFRDEPPVTSFGTPAEVKFTSATLVSGAGSDVRLADLTGNERPEIIRLKSASESGSASLEVFDREGTKLTDVTAADTQRLLVADIDNDGNLDIFAHGAGASHFFAGSGDGKLAERTGDFGLADARGGAAVAFDFDIEGDLDLLVAGNSGVELYRNSLSGALEPVGSKSLPGLSVDSPSETLASDLDRDGDLDVMILGDSGTTRLVNLRQGRFAALEDSLAIDDAERIASADFDNDGWPDLVAVGSGVRFWRNNKGDFEAWDLGRSLQTSARFSALAVFDADNDGRLDLAVGGAGGLAVLAQRDGAFAFLPVEGGPLQIESLAAADLDGDGDLDLVAQAAEGVFRLDNQGGNRNKWLTLRLKGLVKGNSKNNIFGLGATLEVRAGSAYQFREVTEDVTHFGLGQLDTPDLVRVVWTNGVPQNRFQPGPNQYIVEEQVLKGSCPFVYAWDGEGFAFESDLLWGAPAGLPVAEGIWAGADAEELVRLDALQARDGLYELRLTEELWEAAFIDYSRLWIVDHPIDTEVASTLKVVPGRVLADQVLTSRGLRPVAEARDASGNDVTERVRRRDEVYADGWSPSAYQGVASEPWTFEFDLGGAPNKPVRLHLDGWIFPADASLNLALDQRPDYRPHAPRLDTLTAEGWVPLVENMGFPAGKTKTMVVDTPQVPEGASRLRIVSNQWLSWDRIAWTVEPVDDVAVVQARLEPKTAELRFRGFSRLVRQAPNAPHTFDYSQTSMDSPWLPFPGNYTRYGDVRELLLQSDSRSVILGVGDEIALVFDGSGLGELDAGMKRSLFLESHGWDKDADRNTFAAAQVEPLPFRGMSGYPYGDDESFPDTPLHREYLETYQTRTVE